MSMWLCENNHAYDISGGIHKCPTCGSRPDHQLIENRWVKVNNVQYDAITRLLKRREEKALTHTQS